ncbi:hydroxymethylbilane synthase [Selenihalanaerobacter shriftii]|uniref:Porphobilinogen deaminase n=1 Tax=Selenihalanaerobacter shriftii TaxID=142842 RepID=A0A1T4MIF2_9FIRM|nr:hydroxymethylbilane synthase [Selenihalanaerobacter shriftii]SJZ66626.1 hydroxymethylbilane synthase [Selenihalanaerobacter shriftii]
MKNNKVIIGTRKSQLAVGQTQLVADMLADAWAEYEFELKKIVTKGDKILDKPLAQVGGKGLFIKELEVSLLESKIDLAIHSMKDMPAELPNNLEITAIPKRVNPRDVLISNNNLLIDELPKGARIGTGSLRRTSQLLSYRSDLDIVPIRGNIDTRIKKLQDEELNLDAIVLAAAGLIRMGWEDKITQYLEPDVILPAAGQGALAIETREDDEKIKEIVSRIDDQETKYRLEAERAFLEYLEGDCQVPIGALAKVEGDNINLEGMVATLDGKETLQATISGIVDEASDLGVKLAKDLAKKGAHQILKKARQETDK